jgi:hypothetical protein
MDDKLIARMERLVRMVATCPATKNPGYFMDVGIMSEATSILQELPDPDLQIVRDLVADIIKNAGHGDIWVRAYQAGSQDFAMDFRMALAAYKAGKAAK